MILAENELVILCDVAIKAAKKAGDLITSYTNKNVVVENKSSGTSLASQVVTKVDFLCQEDILNTLKISSVTYDLGLLTEESPDDGSRFEKDYFWCIDPIDGTLAFIKGREGYSVSIALVSREGVAVIGVVYNPVSGIMYHAIRGQGAFINNKKWVLAKLTNQLTFVGDDSFSNHSRYNELLTKLNTLRKRVGYDNFQVIQQGGAVMNAIWVLENSPAFYFKLPKGTQGGGSLWDYAATACLFNELQMMNGDVQGRVLNLNRVESIYFNHCGVLFSTDDTLTDTIIEFCKQ